MKLRKRLDMREHLGRQVLDLNGDAIFPDRLEAWHGEVAIRAGDGVMVEAGLLSTIDERDAFAEQGAVLAGHVELWRLADSNASLIQIGVWEKEEAKSPSQSPWLEK